MPLRELWLQIANWRHLLVKIQTFLTKIWTLNFDCRTSLSRNKNFSARVDKIGGEFEGKIFAHQIDCYKVWEGIEEFFDFIKKF
jgi:hypothetical protein